MTPQSNKIKILCRKSLWSLCTLVTCTLLNLCSWIYGRGCIVFRAQPGRSRGDGICVSLSASKCDLVWMCLKKSQFCFLPSKPFPSMSLLSLEEWLLSCLCTIRQMVNVFIVEPQREENLLRCLRGLFPVSFLSLNRTTLHSRISFTETIPSTAASIRGNVLLLQYFARSLLTTSDFTSDPVQTE